MLRNFIRKSFLLRSMLFPVIYLRRFFLKKTMLVKIEVVNNLSKMFIEDPILEVKEFNGAFKMNAKSHLFSRLATSGEYEPVLVDFCKKYLDNNKDVIDVGANIGFFSVYFAKLLKAGRVVSIEPTSNALGYLHDNIALNRVGNKILVYEGVASDFCGKLEIKTITGKEEYSSLGVMEHPSINGDGYTTEIINSITLDDLIKEKEITPGFIKVDVEGMEHLVFKGSKSLLKLHRPIVISELSDFLLRKNGSSASEVVSLIKECDYDVFDPYDPSSTVGVKDFGDIICFPKEMNIKL